jgi:hypothetical protein
VCGSIGRPFYLAELGGVERVHRAGVREQWWTLMDMALNLREFIKEGKFVDSVSK